MLDTNAVLSKIRVTATPVKAKKLKAKQRKTRRILKLNPQRDIKPTLMVDRQVKRAKDMLDSRKVLSRGQRKRLGNKQRFITQKLLEERNKKDVEALNQTVQIKTKEIVKKKKTGLQSMTGLMSGIEKAEKQAKHQNRLKEHASKSEVVDKEKQRLNQIANL